MDFESNAAKNCNHCIKPIKNERTNGNDKNTNDLIVIDDDDSLDSAYETGSAVSRSTQSSPTVDVPTTAIKTDKNDSTDSQQTMHFFANICYKRNIIAPWPLCLRKRVIHAADSKRQHPVSNAVATTDTIVISDSDSDCDETTTAVSSKELDSTMNSSASNSDIINLVSSDEENEDEPAVDHHIVEAPDGKTRKIPDYYMAHEHPPNPRERLPSGLRVIARRKKDRLPIGYSEHGATYLYRSDDTAFYAGILSCECFERNGCYYYLVFFDDGHAQYVPSNKIRLVFGNYGKKYVHENAQKFYDYYFYRVKSQRMVEVLCKMDKNFSVFLNNRFELAKVAEYNANKRPAMVLMHFLKSHQAEWLYIGSPRFEHVWKLINKDKQLQQYHQANETLIEVSSDSEEDECDFKSPQKQPLPIDAKDPMQKTIMMKPENLIDDYKPTQKLDRQHTCGKRCVREFEKNAQIFEYDPLKRPILAGWTRKITGICFYIAPCGRPFNTLDATYKYLYTTKSKLTIDCFSFSSNIECMKEVISYNDTNRQHFLNDLIPGGCKEKRRIPVVPIANNLPHFREYATQNRRNSRSKKVPSFLNDTTNNEFRSGCDCDDDCSDKDKCSCWQLTIDGTRRTSGYTFKRLEGRVETGIYECNPSCKCSSKCLNRVVSAQIEQKLELYETTDRGYGLRCQTDLPKGTFIACYFGDILHGKTADERAMRKGGSFYGDEYFMQLDHIEVAEEYKEGYESDVSEIDENSDVENPSKRFKMDEKTTAAATAPAAAPATNGINNMISYFPNFLKKKTQDEVNQRTILYGQDAVEFVVDGRYRGNIARFFNHSCQPNLFSQTIFVDTHDLRFPWISFFSSEDIKAGTELTWDYGYQVGSIFGREIQCRCGAENCRKRLL